MKPLPIACVVLLLFAAPHNSARAELRAGAAQIDVTPVQFPVLVNGGMTGRSAERAVTRLYARAVVVDDGTERAAIVVVDSCMMPRALLDDAKQLASQRTRIRPDRMLISATHTHTAPASMGCLGTDADPTYVPYLREKLAEAIAAAESHLEPARVGWGVGNAAEFTALRRWILRPDRVRDDPFGNPTVRANMHAGRNWDDAIGESGPEDPDLSLISFATPDGRPIAVLANFSMHYFSGVQALNADYFGMFCTGLESRIGGEPSPEQPPFVALMSHGCSGDIWRRDYKMPADQGGAEWTIDTYTQGLLDVALQTHRIIEHHADADLAMAERRMPMKYRVPDKQRLLWAQQVVAAMGDRPPKTTEEVYAREQIILDQWQSTEVVVQALRIGDIAIATTPNETYALTGLKIKLQSPLAATMVIELANGGDGYIPPPEQHQLGGYNTWAARSAGLEVSAEPRIAEAALELLEQVAQRPRQGYRQSSGPAAARVLAAKPLAYWRLDEFAAPRAADSTSHHRDAFYEPGVVFFLEGPRSAEFCLDRETNRAAHFAGGRLQSRFSGLGDRYSISLWFWNGMPNDARETAGWFYSRGHDFGLGPASEHLGLGGTATVPGRLVFQQGSGGDDAERAVGRTAIERWTWNRVVLVRDGAQVRVFLNGAAEPEIEMKGNSAAALPSTIDTLFFGGRSDNQDNWEGRLDEIAVFDRALSNDEAAALSAP